MGPSSSLPPGTVLHDQMTVSSHLATTEGCMLWAISQNGHFSEEREITLFCVSYALCNRSACNLD